MSKSIHSWFAEYSESHKNPTNKAIHFVAVPGIYLSVLGLLWSIPVPGFFPEGINWLSLAVIAVFLFYFRLSWQIALGMLAMTLLMVIGIVWLSLVSTIPLWFWSLALFVALWALQFIGHAIEGVKPSFFKDVQFLLIGPAWVIGFLYRKLGISY